MEVGPDGVAIITLINPPVNSLSFDGDLSPSRLNCVLLCYIVLSLCGVECLLETCLVFMIGDSFSQ